MPVITSTASDQKERLFDNFDGNVVTLSSIGGKTYYVSAPNETAFSDWSVRDAEETITTTALSVNTYTVADGTKFRLDEVLPVLDSSDEQIGAVKITDISGNDITVSEIQSFTKTSGDKLVLRRDTYIAEDSASEFDTGLMKLVIFKCESSSVDLIGEIMGTGVKKKF